MVKIDTLTSSPLQKLSLRLEDGKLLKLTLKYSYTQSGWFYSLVYGSYSLNNRRLVNSLNILDILKNILPFGIVCSVPDKYEPVFVDDFVSGRVSLYIANSEDLQVIEGLV